MEINNYKEASQLIKDTHSALIHFILELMTPIKKVSFDLGNHLAIESYDQCEDILIWSIVNKGNKIYLEGDDGMSSKVCKIPLTDDRLENWHLLHIIKMIETEGKN